MIMATASAPSRQGPSTTHELSAPPLFSEGWLEFNRVRWNVDLLPVQYGENPFPRLEATFFLGAKGKIWRPPLVPYTSMCFKPSPTHAPFKLGRHWLELGSKIAQETREHGLAGPMYLPPEIADVRPWSWLGFASAVKYTFYIDFPYCLSGADHNVRAKIERAARSGYSCARTQDLKSVYVCLSKTAATQEFAFELSESDLKLAEQLMGAECLRCYVCYAPDGEPASARVVLSTPGNRALVWLAGTNGHLQSGATELLMHHLIEDLQKADLPGLDFVGANLPRVAEAKAKWGSRLVPFYTIQAFSMRELAKIWYAAWRAGIVRWWEI